MYEVGKAIGLFCVSINHCYLETPPCVRPGALVDPSTRSLPALNMHGMYRQFDQSVISPCARHTRRGLEQSHGRPHSVKRDRTTISAVMTHAPHARRPSGCRCSVLGVGEPRISHLERGDDCCLNHRTTCMLCTFTASSARHASWHTQSQAAGHPRCKPYYRAHPNGRWTLLQPDHALSIALHASRARPLKRGDSHARYYLLQPLPRSTVVIKSG